MNAIKNADSTLSVSCDFEFFADAHNKPDADCQVDKPAESKKEHSAKLSNIWKMLRCSKQRWRKRIGKPIRAGSRLKGPFSVSGAEATNLVCWCVSRANQPHKFGGAVSRKLCKPTRKTTANKSLAKSGSRAGAIRNSAMLTGSGGRTQRWT